MGTKIKKMNSKWRSFFRDRYNAALKQNQFLIAALELKISPPLSWTYKNTNWNLHGVKFRVFDIIESMENVWNIEWKKLSMEWNGMEDFDGYGIWKIFILFHSIACPANNNRQSQI